MGEYEDMASFASMFSNSNAGGKMPKKKSASARQKAKAKGMKNAAYVALGKPAGKKGKDSKGKNSGSKGSGSKGSSSSSSSSSSASKVRSSSSPYVTAASLKATAIKNKAFTSPYVSAGSRSAKPAAKPMSAADMKSSAAIALGNPSTKQVRAKSTKSTTTKTAPKSGSRPTPSAKTNWR